jgi:hypothetical protein
MKLAVMLIWVAIISFTGQTAQTAISDDANSPYSWSNHASVNNIVGDTQQTAIDSNSLIANNYISFSDKVLSWIKDTYRVWVANDNYESARLLLLSFGLVGLVGIRRRFKKRRSAQYSGEKKKVGSQ